MDIDNTITICLTAITITGLCLIAWSILLAYKIKAKTLVVPIYCMYKNKLTLIGFIGSGKDHNFLEVRIYPAFALRQDQVFELFGECVVSITKQSFDGTVTQFNINSYEFLPGSRVINA